MAATREDEALASLRELQSEREKLDIARRQHGRAYLRYLRDARAAGWSWMRIGRSIGLSDVAVRRHWDRNRHSAGRMGRTTDATPTDAQAL